MNINNEPQVRASRQMHWFFNGWFDIRNDNKEVTTNQKASISNCVDSVKYWSDNSRTPLYFLDSLNHWSPNISHYPAIPDHLATKLSDQPIQHSKAPNPENSNDYQRSANLSTETTPQRISQIPSPHAAIPIGEWTIISYSLSNEIIWHNWSCLRVASAELCRWECLWMTRTDYLESQQ